MNKTNTLVMVFSLLIACSQPKKQEPQHELVIVPLSTVTPTPANTAALRPKANKEVKTKRLPLETPARQETTEAEEFKSNDADIDTNFKQKELEAKAAIALSKHTTLKIVWAMPKSSADFFIIDFGFSANALTRRLKIKAKNLSQKEGHYSYQLTDIPKDETVYFTIQSINKLGRSEKSLVHAAKPSLKK